MGLRLMTPTRSILRPHAFVVYALLLVGCSGTPPPVPTELPDDARPRATVPGEFEPQQAIAIAWPRFATDALPSAAKAAFVDPDQLYCDLVAAVAGRIPLVVLVEDSQARERVAALLGQRQIPANAVHFLHVPFASEWIRDYGPLTVRTGDGSWRLLDAEFVEGPVGVYPYEDRMPATLGRLLQVPTVRVPLSVQHGNVLSNGRGLFLATRKMVDENAGRRYGQDDVRRVLREFYGAAEVVFLEPLAGEPTGHVDMFATWTSADTVLIGQYPPDYDPRNAAILDRNAERVARAEVAGRRVTVVRIPMPPRVAPRSGTELWATYTNVAYANGVLLLPVYPRWAPEVEAAAEETYRRLLPDWTVAKVNAVPILRTGGSIHCVTMNLPRVGQWGQNPEDSPPQLPGAERRPATGVKGAPWYGAWPADDAAASATVVRLAGTDAADEDLIAVGRMTELKMLDLRDTRVTDEGLRHLSGLKQLEILVLTGTTVSDQGLEQLTAMPALKVLCLDETRVTSAGLSLLRGLTQLGWLNLSHTGITAAGLSQLRDCPALEILILDPCPLRPDEMSAFREAAPGVQVYDGTRRRPAFHRFSYKHFP